MKIKLMNTYKIDCEMLKSGWLRIGGSWYNLKAIKNINFYIDHIDLDNIILDMSKLEVNKIQKIITGYFRSES